MDDTKLIDTPTVAKRLGTSITNIGSYLSRHPHLRPARRAGTAYLWTPEEYDRYVQFRMRPLSRGKKKQD